MLPGCTAVYIRELSLTIAALLGTLYCSGLSVLLSYYSSNKALHDLLMRHVTDSLIVWPLRDRNSWKEIVITITNSFSLHFIKTLIHKCITQKFYI
jgi:flagellar biosynthesis protein FliR